MTATATPPATAPSKQGEGGSPDSKGSLLSETTQQTAAEGKPETPPADQGKTPEVKYDFKAPEGAEFDPEVIKSYTEVAREVALAPEAAQKVLDKIAPVLQARFAEQAKAMQDQFRSEQESAWRKETSEDKDLGGQNLKANVAFAIAGAKDLGGQELFDLLDSHGLGSNRIVFGALVKHGKAISQDKFVPATGGGTRGTDTGRLEDVLYPKQ